MHQEHAKYIELCIFGGLVIEEVVIGKEELLECWIIVAPSDRKYEMCGNCNYECLRRDCLISGNALDSVDVGWNGKMRMDLATLLHHPFAQS